MPESDEDDEDYVPAAAATHKRKKAKTENKKNKTQHSSRGCSDDLKRLLKEGLICVNQRCFKNIRHRGGSVRLNLKVNSEKNIALESGNGDHVNSDLLNKIMQKLGAKSSSRASMYETLRVQYRCIENEDLTIDFGLHEISAEKLIGYQPDMYQGSKEDKEYAKEQLKRFFEGLNRDCTHIGPDPQQLVRYNLITGTLNELPPSDFEIACARQRAEQDEFEEVNRILDQWEKNYTEQFEIREDEVIHIDHEKVNAVLAVPDEQDEQYNDDEEEEEQGEYTEAESDKLNQLLSVPDSDENAMQEEEEQSKLNETLQMPDLFNNVDVPVVQLRGDCEAAFLQ